MSDPAENSPPPQRVPAEPLRRIDWLAVAPWLLILRAPGAVMGWPFVIGSLGLLALTPWTVRLIHDQDLHEAVLPYLAMFPNIVLEPWFYGLPDDYPAGFVGYALRLLCWLLIGTAIVHQSAALLVDATRPGVGTTIRRTWRHCRRVVGGLLLLLSMAAPFAVALWLFRVCLEVPGLGAVAAPLITVAGVLLAIPLALILIVLTVGAPLLVSAVVIDDADAFDAVSRAVAYTLQRPLTLAWCVGVAAFGGFVSGALLEVVYRVSLGVLHTAASDPEAVVGERGIYFWSIPYTLVTHGFYPAYTFVAGAAVYLVMRKAIDGQPIDEIVVQPSADA